MDFNLTQWFTAMDWHGMLVLSKALRKELLAQQELEMAAHKQGINTLAEMKSAETDPDGEMFFLVKPPSPDIVRHRELLDRLEHLTAEMAELRKRLDSGSQN